MPTDYIYLLPKLGVQGDIHCAQSPTSSPRQVHLIDSSLFASLAKSSSKHNYPTFHLSPGSLGENITTSNIDLFSLSEGTKLYFGDGAVVRISGLREPSKRLGEWPEGLLDRCAVKDKKGRVVGRKIGVYATVEREGYVQPGCEVRVKNPKSFKALEYV